VAEKTEWVSGMGLDGRLVASILRIHGSTYGDWSILSLQGTRFACARIFGRSGSGKRRRMVEATILDAPMFASIAFGHAMVTLCLIYATGLTRSWLSISSARIPGID
jgi:hypothetical protein